MNPPTHLAPPSPRCPCNVAYQCAVVMLVVRNVWGGGMFVRMGGESWGPRGANRGEQRLGGG